MSGKIVVEISIGAPGWHRLEKPAALCERAVGAALKAAGRQVMKGAQLSILFTNDAEMRRLNRAWRNQDKPTNVLSFPAVPVEGLKSSPLIGDIALGLETICAEALGDGKDLHDHVTHLVIHGFLHILGYDHISSAEAETMEAMEIDILRQFGVANPYANSDLLHARSDELNP